MHLPLTDRLARVPKIIILIMTLKILIILWFGDWEMGKWISKYWNRKRILFFSFYSNDLSMSFPLSQSPYTCYFIITVIK